MAGRRSVWSDARVATLAAEFVATAADDDILRHGDGRAGELYRAVIELGHYGGLEAPSTTRQGFYAVAPDGKLLGSCNSRDPTIVARMLDEALREWRATPRSGPRPDADATSAPPMAAYPDDGLVLRVVARDLPRSAGHGDWRDHAWNQDFVWFTAAEASRFVSSRAPGTPPLLLPSAIARRLARCHLLDGVRGRVPALDEQHIDRAWLAVSVESVGGQRIVLRVSGASRTRARGVWRTAGFAGDPVPQECVVDVRLDGRAVFDRTLDRFVEFEMVALGERSGAWQFNERGEDPGPSGIGFWFTLGSGEPIERLPPANLHAYGW